jgi:hypothetical protein
MKNLAKGLVIGAVLILLMGSASQMYDTITVIMSGKLETSTISYQSALSGVDGDGRCFLAVTNVHTGRTTLFRIEDSKKAPFDTFSLRPGKQGRVIAEVAE